MCLINNCAKIKHVCCYGPLTANCLSRHGSYRTQPVMNIISENQTFQTIKKRARIVYIRILHSHIYFTYNMGLSKSHRRRDTPIKKAPFENNFSTFHFKNTIRRQDFANKTLEILNIFLLFISKSRKSGFTTKPLA